MSRSTFLVSTLASSLLLFSLNAPLGAQEEEAPEVPEGWIVVPDEIWIFLLDEPSGYFQDAHEDYLAGDVRSAARNLNKGIAFLSIELPRAKKETKNRLKASVSELRQLARAIESGALKTRTQLEDAFARAEFALAEHYFELAGRYEAKGKDEYLAYALDATVSHLLQAAAWANEDLDVDEAVAAKEARSLSRKFTQGAEKSTKKVKEGLKSVGQSLSNLGKKIKPGK